MPLQPKVTPENLKLRIADRAKEIPPPDNEDGSFNMDGYKYTPGKYDPFMSWFTFAHDNEKYARQLYFNPFIHKNTTFLDVGALCGSWTLPGLVLGAYVISIEPDPNFFNILANNVSINNFTKWTGINCGAYKEDITADVYDMTNIDLRRLDNIEELNQKKIDYVKMDVEGAEIEALQGAHKLLRNDRPILWIECHNELGVSAENVRDELLKIFGPKYLLEQKIPVKNSPHLFGRPSNPMPFCFKCDSELCIQPQEHLIHPEAVRC